MKGAINFESFDFCARDVTPADFLEQGRNISKHNAAKVSANMKTKLIERIENLEQLCYHFIYFHMSC